MVPSPSANPVGRRGILYFLIVGRERRSKNDRIRNAYSTRSLYQNDEFYRVISNRRIDFPANDLQAQLTGNKERSMNHESDGAPSPKNEDLSNVPPPPQDADAESFLSANGVELNVTVEHRDQSPAEHEKTIIRIAPENEDPVLEAGEMPEESVPTWVQKAKTFFYRQAPRLGR